MTRIGGPAPPVVPPDAGDAPKTGAKTPAKADHPTPLADGYERSAPLGNGPFGQTALSTSPSQSFKTRLDSLTQDFHFKRLDPGTQKQVLEQVVKYANDPVRAQNLVNVATAIGLDQLPAAQQRQVIDALAKGPADPKLGLDLSKLVGNPAFHKMDEEGRGRLLSLIGAHATDAKTRGNLTGLPDGKAFKSLDPFEQTTLLIGVDGLPPEARRSVVGALGANRNDVAFARELSQLFGGTQINKLGEDVKTRLLGAIAQHAADPAARGTLTKLAEAPGFAALGEAAQKRLVGLVGGTNRDLAPGHREALDKLLASAAFTKADAKGQQKLLDKFLTQQPGAPGVVAPAEGAFDGKRQAYTLHGPTEIKNHAFRGAKVDAQKYEVEIDGKKIPVIVPKSPDGKKGAFHTADEIAKSLAALPASSRAEVRQVTMNAVRNPDDPYWARKYKDPNFTSYMTAGAAGNVVIYPTKGANSQSYMDGTMIHETGHTLSKKAWGNEGDKRWNPWKEAMKSDQVVASKYAKNSPDEDFAETLQLYEQVRGTPQEAEMRALMPERFRLIDKLLAAKPPEPAKAKSP